MADAAATAIKVESLAIVEVKTMGFRKHLDYNTMHHNIYIAGVEMNDPRNDGFIQWGIKQDLYKIKWLIEEMIEQSPKFVGEDEFVLKHDMQVVWDKLQK